jgi:Cd2+/Zn2+-exporting ATPase/Cu+-exporting ATPase
VTELDTAHPHAARTRPAGEMRAAAHAHVHDDHDPDHRHDHDHGHHHGHDHDEEEHEHHGFDWLTAVRIAVAGLCSVAIWFVEVFWFETGSVLETIHEAFDYFDPWKALALIDFLPQPLVDALPPGVTDWINDWLAMPFSTYAYVAVLFSGWPILKAAVQDILKLRMTMELSMTIALLAGLFTGYFFVAAFIVFFVLIAEVLEGLTVERGRRAIHELLEFLPRQVVVRRGGTTAEIHVDGLRQGEVVLVSPGGRIPVDGAVVAGFSFADESRITGESMPVEKVAGSTVYAGSINQSGALEVRTERIGADTSYGKIIEAVEQAERSRAPIARISDRLAGYIVLFAIAFAIFTQLMWGDVMQSLSVLVVAGACGVAAGTPLAILGAIGRAARLGAIVKGGVHLEKLWKVDTVILDKTGTLTFGEPRLKTIYPAPGVGQDEVLTAAATAEFRSEHPLGKAILDHARKDGRPIVEPADFHYLPGRGIAANAGGQRILVGNEAWMTENHIAVGNLNMPNDGGASVVYVGRGDRLLGAITIADAMRPDARVAVAALQKRGIRTILLTGDGMPVALAISRELGITEVEANQLPEDKVARVRALVGQGRVVAMVGDGVNDAPALAEASVGVAMGSGTDVARESADLVLLGNDLARFVDTIDLARWTRRIIYMNFVGTVAVDTLGVAAAMAGLIGPVWAIQIHTVSELVFILNSARLLPRWNPFKRPAPGTAVPEPAE